MPTWTPNREDVRFDAGLAEKAALECDEMATRLSIVFSTLAGQVTGAQSGWTGMSRQGFDQGHVRVHDEQVTTQSALTALAAEIRAAATAASAEQQHRVDERARWQREYDAEKAANPPCLPGHPC